MTLSSKKVLIKHDVMKVAIVIVLRVDIQAIDGVPPCLMPERDLSLASAVLPHNAELIGGIPGLCGTKLLGNAGGLLGGGEGGRSPLDLDGLVRLSSVRV